MATLQKIRDKFGIIVAVLIGLSLLSFIIFTGTGNNSIFSNRNKQFEIARVAGKSISIMDYNRRVSNLTEIYKLSGNTNMDEATSKMIREQVWEDMIRENILTPEYKKLGLDVSPDELFDLVQGNNPHPLIRQIFTDKTTGIFNRSALIRFLKNMENDETGQQKKYWLFLEKQIYNERRITKYLGLIRQGLFATDFEAHETYVEDNKKTDFKYVSQLFDVIPDTSIIVTMNDLKAYYKKHKKNYQQKAERKIEYVTFDVVPSPKDIQLAEDWINKIKPEFEAAKDVPEFVSLNSDIPYQDRHYGYGELTPDTLNDIMFNAEPGFVYGPYKEEEAFKLARLAAIDYLPDSVHARHILIALDPKKTKEAIKQKADSIKNLIEKGTDFALLASTVSDDKGSAQLGGDLGWFKEGMMVKPFSDACFFGKKHDLLVVETRFGYHVIEILDQSKKVKKLEIGFIVRNIEPSSDTYNQIYSQASRFAGVNNTYDKFKEAIKKNNLEKHVAVIGKNDENIPGLESARPFIRAAFKTEKDNIILSTNNQAVFELGDKFVIGYITEAKTEGIAPLKDVEEDIRLQVTKEKKGDALVIAFKKEMKDVKTLDDLASKINARIREASGITFNSFTIPGAGIEPALNAVAYVWPPNRLTSPVKGLNGVYVLEITSVTEPDSISNYNQIKTRLMANFQTRTNFEAYNALKKHADIKDERAKFF